MRSRAMFSVALALGFLLFACAHQPAPPLALEAPPFDEDVRRAVASDLAHQLFESLRAGRPSRVLAPEREIDELLLPEARMRVTQERRRVVHSEPDARFQVWQAAQYRGFCAQGPQRAVVSNIVRGKGWTFGRILIAADLHGVTSACWVEGAFAFAGGKFRTLSLSRIDPIRPRHADLELAPCDVEEGVR